MDQGVNKFLLCTETQCSVVAPIFQYATGRELSRALEHAKAYRHQRRQCRYGRECTRFKRNSDVSQQATQISISEQAKYDEAHCLIFHHQVDMHTFENVNFSAFQAIPRPAVLPTVPRVSKSADMESLIREANDNGFGNVWTTPTGGNLRDVARTKLRHPIHIMLGKPLSKAEMLAILLYTGTRIQPDFNHCHRKGDFGKWKTLRSCLQSAIVKLYVSGVLSFVWRYHKAIGTRFAGERVTDEVLRTWNKLDPLIPQGSAAYSFLYVTGPDQRKCEYSDENQAVVNFAGVEYPAELVSVDEFLRDRYIPMSLNRCLEFPESGVPTPLWRGIKKTRFDSVGDFPSQFEYCDFLSTTTSRSAAEKFLGQGQDQGILFSLERDESTDWADVSWISKFADEREILFAPTRWVKGDRDVVHANFRGENGQPCSCVVAHYKLSNLPI